MRVVATDARSASVAGHVVRSSIILQPGGRGSASVTAATSHEALDMDADDMQGPSGPLLDVWRIIGESC